MTTRFTPSNIIPSEFRYGTSYDLGGNGPGDIPFNLTEAGNILDAGAGPIDNFQDLGTCCVCGTNFRYGEVWIHEPSDKRICLGHVCALKYDLVANDPTYDRLRMAHVNKLKRLAERRRVRAEIKDFLKTRRTLGAALKADHYIVRDLRAKLIHWGSLSEKQVALAEKIAREINERAAAEAEKNYVAVPETAKRIEITGRVLGIKWTEGYGYYSADVAKMIVEVEADGGVYKLYGTMPESLQDEIMKLAGDDNEDGLKGAVKKVQPRVRFMAKVERSRDDIHFGFFKRPTQAEVLA